jgi:hypothetical protein
MPYTFQCFNLRDVPDILILHYVHNLSVFIISFVDVLVNFQLRPPWQSQKGIWCPFSYFRCEAVEVVEIQVRFHFGVTGYTLSTRGHTMVTMIWYHGQLPLRNQSVVVVSRQNTDQNELRHFCMFGGEAPDYPGSCVIA